MKKSSMKSSPRFPTWKQTAWSAYPKAYLIQVWIIPRLVSVFQSQKRRAANCQCTNATKRLCSTWEITSDGTIDATTATSRLEGCSVPTCLYCITNSGQGWLKCTISGPSEGRHVGAGAQRNEPSLAGWGPNYVLQHTAMCCSVTCATKLPTSPEVMLFVAWQQGSKGTWA